MTRSYIPTLQSHSAPDYTKKLIGSDLKCPASSSERILKQADLTLDQCVRLCHSKCKIRMFAERERATYNMDDIVERDILKQVHVCFMAAILILCLNENVICCLCLPTGIHYSVAVIASLQVIASAIIFLGGPPMLVSSPKSVFFVVNVQTQTT